MKILRSLQEELQTILESSEHNTNYGRAYEIATVLHTHYMSGSKHNPDPEYKKKIEGLKQRGEEAFNALPDNLRKTVLSSSQKSASSYLDSLEKNSNIKRSDIAEVHHTPTGISSHVGQPVDTKENPHDMLVKTHQGEMHGASLKAKTGTLSNNSVTGVDNEIGTNMAKHYEEARKKVGLEGKSKEEIKAMGKTEDITKATHVAQEGAANEYIKGFNKLDDKKKLDHMMTMLKAHPGAVPYDYVNGQKGTSTPSGQLPHVQKLMTAKNITAVKSKSIGGIEIRDHNGEVIARGEHRPTHSGIKSPQLNFKV